MAEKVVIKVQLPSILSQPFDGKLQLLGYNFDPTNRLTQISSKQDRYKTSNIGDVVALIRDQLKRVVGIYDNKDWKHLLRPLQGFAFDVEVIVRVVNLKEPNIKVKSMDNKVHKSIYEVVTLISNQLPGPKELSQSINRAAEVLIAKISQKTIQRQFVSLIPQKMYNPHLFIKTQQKEKCIEFYTKGIYQYFHYGDQDCNDHGWGCAYRSLQTILSWMNLQAHCKLHKMLTLPEIQETIDMINLASDQRLKGTRQWIGATEVSWVIKRMTTYDCRIVHIADGKDIIQHCEVFREHFEKVGCPIMYGGGQYAYSIVGLNYSWQLGECQFLILDPHYPGNDSLDKVLQKKGLAWRKPDEMFKKGIFYNFCLPLVPTQQQ